MQENFVPDLNQQTCEHCGMLGFHSCPHKEILQSIADRKLAEDQARIAEKLALDTLAREFWERAALLITGHAAQNGMRVGMAITDIRAIDTDASTPLSAVTDWADALTTEWRKRFAKEGA